MKAFYNEWSAYPAQWLRNLMYAGHISKGVVDARSITEIKASDLAGITRAHFFAGIGVWDLAMRNAGWPDDLNVWSASLPCQPFSVAGFGKAEEDDRHLWPVFRGLYRQCRPAVIVGEQVSSPDGLDWLDAVHDELEEDGYAVGAIVAAAASVGAPHARHRIYWGAIDLTPDRLAVTRDAFLAVADPAGQRSAWGHGVSSDQQGRGARPGPGAERRGEAHGVANTDGDRLAVIGSPRVHADGQRGHDADGRGETDRRTLADANRKRSRRNTRAADRTEEEDQREGHQRGAHGEQPQPAGAARIVGITDGSRLEGLAGSGNRVGEPRWHDAAAHGSHATAGFWSPCDWVDCRDGKRRPIEPGTFPLADGVTARVGRLSAFGNAVVEPLANAFLRCFRDALMETFDGNAR